MVMIFKRNNFSSRLLEELSKNNIPTTIFINEQNIYHNEVTTKNFAGLIAWLKNKNITAGNHSYSHLNYADVSAEAFKEDVVKGEIITRETLKQLNLSLKYFRFPYNSLGIDSVAHREMEIFLHQKGYVIAPFTVESEDWMYSAIYESALKSNDPEKAKRWGEYYVATTLALFDYFEKLCVDRFGRSIRHIYLCHDNQLNTDYLPAIIKGLGKNGYSFITLERALEDKVYGSPDHYYGRAGFSWIYRWELDKEKRKTLLQAAPENKLLYAEYEQVMKARK